MDQNRQIRFLIPPFFMFLSMGWDAYLAGHLTSISDFLLSPDKSIASGFLLAAISAGVAAIPLGFGIGSISVLLLTIISWLCSDCSTDRRVLRYESATRHRNLRDIWTAVGRTVDENRGHFAFFALVVVDHELSHERIHEWTRRRWNAFNISVNCGVAIILAHLVAGMIFLKCSHLDWRFWVPTLGFLLVFLCNAKQAWRDTMDMVDFQVTRRAEAWNIQR